MQENMKRILVFVSVTFFLNYLMALIYYLLGGKYNTVSGTLVAVGYMLIPALVTVVLQKVIYKETLKSLGISWRINRWWFVGWLLMPVLALATLGVSLLIPGVEYSPEMAGMFERFKALMTPEQLQQMKEQVATMPVHPVWLLLAQGLIAGATVNAVAGFGEELGWRGFMQKYLGYLGFWKSSLIIGFIWGIWHAPLVIQGHNYPQHPEIGVVMMTLWTILLAPVISYITVKAGSVIAAAILHGTLNATFGLSVMLIKGGNDLTTGLTGLPGIVVLLAANFVIYLYDRYVTKEPVNVLLNGRC